MLVSHSATDFSLKGRKRYIIAEDGEENAVLGEDVQAQTQATERIASKATCKVEERQQTYFCI